MKVFLSHFFLDQEVGPAGVNEQKVTVSGKNFNRFGFGTVILCLNFHKNK